jgi:hypothetical protein
MNENIAVFYNGDLNESRSPVAQLMWIWSPSGYLPEKRVPILNIICRFSVGGISPEG